MCGDTIHPGRTSARPETQMTPSEEKLDETELAHVDRLSEAYRKILAEAGKIIVGQQSVLEQILIAMFARGHVLLVGVPGLAKTLMIRTVSQAFSLTFSRIQFTPDLMPSDITGTDIITRNEMSGDRTFKFIRGPIFANLVLADEINRTPPKTQAALLEAMQELQVTVAGQRHTIDAPFFVLATQNPIDQEGTYPLPEAQLDRFMFNIFVDYPTEEDELNIVRMTTSDASGKVSAVLDGAEVLEIQKIVRKVPVPEHVIRYATGLVRRTRNSRDGSAPDFINKYVSYGAGPRASQYLVMAGKARAILHGRYFVTTEDIRSVAPPVLRHRMILNFNAEAEGVRPDDLVRRLIDSMPRDESEALNRGPLSEVLGSGRPGSAQVA
jgi:MoxR-like ATPase